MSEEAKQCPFCCGIEIDVFFRQWGSAILYYAECFDCDAQGPPAETEDRAIERWNERCGE